MDRFEKDGLSQGDPCFQNVDWRVGDSQRELVVFDLEGLNVGHRFENAINVMADLRERDCALSQAEMIAQFLDEYDRFGGPPVTREGFLENVACFTMGEMFWSLPFGYRMATSGDLIDWTDDIETGLGECRQDLNWNLVTLLDAASPPIHRR